MYNVVEMQFGIRDRDSCTVVAPHISIGRNEMLPRSNRMHTAFIQEPMNLAEAGEGATYYDLPVLPIWLQCSLSHKECRG